MALVATGWPMATIAGAIVGAVVPEMVARSREERERIDRMEAVSEVASRIRDSLRSGIALQEAISIVARRPPAAIAHDLRRLVADMKIEGIGAAVRSLSRRSGDFSSEVLAAALSVSERFGARNTAEVLDALSEATTSRALTLREARARQTHNRASARIVVATPILLLLIIQRTSPGYLEPFGTPIGQLVLALAFALMGVGYWAMLRAARIEGGEL